MVTNKVKDLNLNLTTHPINKDLVFLKEDDVVKSAVKNIVYTMFHERHFEPLFGTQINSVLFEPISYFSNLIIVSEIQRALTLFEPRVELIGVWGIPDEDNNGYNISISYYIKDNPKQSLITNVFLERIR